MSKLIYILELNANKYYIGTTTNLNRRIWQHKNQINSAKWVEYWGFKSLVYKFKTKNIFDEDNTTKILMNKYGIMNVRGGTYCAIYLSPEHLMTLQNEFDMAHNRCLICGGKYHKTHKCGKVSDIVQCYYCKQYGHRIDNCPII